MEDRLPAICFPALVDGCGASSSAEPSRACALAPFSAAGEVLRSARAHRHFLMRYCGRAFSESELALIRALIAQDPSHTRADLSRLTCQALHWYKPDGGLKQMSCRVAMLRMHRDGLIELPPPRCPRPQARIRFTPTTDPPALAQPTRACLVGAAP